MLIDFVPQRKASQTSKLGSNAIQRAKGKTAKVSYQGFS